MYSVALGQQEPAVPMKRMVSPSSLIASAPSHVPVIETLAVGPTAKAYSAEQSPPSAGTQVLSGAQIWPVVHVPQLTARPRPQVSSTVGVPQFFAARVHSMASPWRRYTSRRYMPRRSGSCTPQCALRRSGRSGCASRTRAANRTWRRDRCHSRLGTNKRYSRRRRAA